MPVPVVLLEQWDAGAAFLDRLVKYGARETFEVIAGVETGMPRGDDAQEVVAVVVVA